MSSLANKGTLRGTLKKCSAIVCLLSISLGTRVSYYTYLHTPWCPQAEWSLRGTCQSIALCGGKNLICTWCRSLCWNRIRSCLSCTLEKRRGKGRDSSGSERNPLIWSWLKAEGFGEGASWKDYTVSPARKQKKKKRQTAMPLWIIPLRASSAFQRVCFCLTGFPFIPLFLFGVRKSTAWKRNSRRGQEVTSSGRSRFQLRVSGGGKNTSH